MKNAGIFSAVMLGIFALFGIITTLNGAMLSYMWEWFVVPLGVRSIGIAHAIGIAIIVSVLTFKATGDKSEDAGEGLNKLLTHLGAKAVCFAIAFGLSFLVAA